MSGEAPPSAATHLSTSLQYEGSPEKSAAAPSTPQTFAELEAKRPFDGDIEGSLQAARSLPYVERVKAYLALAQRAFGPNEARAVSNESRRLTTDNHQDVLDALTDNSKVGLSVILDLRKSSTEEPTMRLRVAARAAAARIADPKWAEQLKAAASPSEVEVAARATLVEWARLARDIDEVTPLGQWVDRPTWEEMAMQLADRPEIPMLRVLGLTHATRPLLRLVHRDDENRTVFYQLIKNATDGSRDERNLAIRYLVDHGETYKGLFRLMGEEPPFRDPEAMPNFTFVQCQFLHDFGEGLPLDFAAEVAHQLYRAEDPVEALKFLELLIRSGVTASVVDDALNSVGASRWKYRGYNEDIRPFRAHDALKSEFVKRVERDYGLTLKWGHREPEASSAL